MGRVTVCVDSQVIRELEDFRAELEAAGFRRVSLVETLRYAMLKNREVVRRGLR